MSDTKPHIGKAFRSGAVFGTSALMLLGIGQMFMQGLFLGFGNPVVGMFCAAAVGTIGMGTIAAASNVIIHTIPGLAKLLGQEHTGYNGPDTRVRSDNKGLSIDEELEYARNAERDIHAPDYLRNQHEVHDAEYHDRLIDEAIAMEEEMRQSMR